MQEPRSLRFNGVHCTLILEQSPSGAVSLRIAGTDIGEFGDAPMQALSEWLADSTPIDLFIDAHEVRGASIEVSGEWARWLADNKSKLREINMLTGSRYIQVTADFVRRFAALEGRMKIYTDPSAFDAVPR